MESSAQPRDPLLTLAWVLVRRPSPSPSTVPPPNPPIYDLILDQGKGNWPHIAQDLLQRLMIEQRLFVYSKRGRDDDVKLAHIIKHMRLLVDPEGWDAEVHDAIFRHKICFKMRRLQMTMLRQGLIRRVGREIIFNPDPTSSPPQCNDVAVRAGASKRHHGSEHRSARLSVPLAAGAFAHAEDYQVVFGPVRVSTPPLIHFSLLHSAPVRQFVLIVLDPSRGSNPTTPVNQPYSDRGSSQLQTPEYHSCTKILQTIITLSQKLLVVLMKASDSIPKPRPPNVH